MATNHRLYNRQNYQQFVTKNNIGFYGGTADLPTDPFHFLVGNVSPNL